MERKKERVRKQEPLTAKNIVSIMSDEWNHIPPEHLSHQVLPSLWPHARTRRVQGLPALCHTLIVMYYIERAKGSEVQRSAWPALFPLVLYVPFALVVLSEDGPVYHCDTQATVDALHQHVIRSIPSLSNCTQQSEKENTGQNFCVLCTVALKSLATLLFFFLSLHENTMMPWL